MGRKRQERRKALQEAYKASHKPQAISINDLDSRKDRIPKAEGIPSGPIEAWRRVGSHPITPIIVGVLVTLDTPGNVIVKSWTFFALWVWLVVDAWLYFREHKRGAWRYVGFCSSSSLAGIAMLVGVLYFVSSDLYEHRKDTFNRWSAAVYLPPNLDPLRSVFTLTNASQNVVAPASKLMCLINVLVGATGTPHFQAGVQSVAWGSGPAIDPGGDASSSECFHTIVGVEGGTTCIDVTLLLNYSIEQQPDVEDSKAFRFVGTRRAGAYTWYRETVNTPHDYCEAYISEKYKPVNLPRLPTQSVF